MRIKQFFSLSANLARNKHLANLKRIAYQQSITNGLSPDSIKTNFRQDALLQNSYRQYHSNAKFQNPFNPLLLSTTLFAATQANLDDDRTAKKTFSVAWLAQELAQLVRNNERILDLRSFDLSEQDIKEIKKLLQNNYWVLRILLPHQYTSNELFADIIARNQAYFSERPSDYIYAVLSKLSYQDDGGTPPDGWHVVKFCPDNQKDGYYGVAYANDKTCQLVVAHRGTDPASFRELLKDLRTDFESVVYNKITSQKPSAYKFAYEIAQEYGGRYRISFTGHSLGGWLAQVTTYHFAEQGYRTQAVTFDSPGAENIIQDKLQPQGKIDRDVDSYSLDITVYLSAPNLIDTCNTHLGSKYRVYPELPIHTGWKKYFKYSLSAHAMEGIVNTFDPTTGLPRDYRKVKRWPRVDWKETNLNIQGSALFAIAKLVWNIKNTAEQYTTFHQLVEPTNRYEPNADQQSFHEQYYTTYKAQYQVEEVNSRQLHFNHLPRDVLAFLRNYHEHGAVIDLDLYLAKLNLAERNKIKELLQTEYNLDEDKGLLSLSNSNGQLQSASEFRQKLTFYLQLYPELKQLKPYLNAKLAVLLKQEDIEQRSWLQAIQQEVDNHWAINDKLLQQLTIQQTQARLYLYADPGIEELLQDEKSLELISKQLRLNQRLIERVKGTVIANQPAENLLHDLQKQSHQLTLAKQSQSAILCYKQRNFPAANNTLKQLISDIKAVNSELPEPINKQELLASCYNLQAKIARVAGDYELAVDYYDKALECLPDNTILLSSKAALLNDMAKYTGDYTQHAEAISLHRQAEISLNRESNKIRRSIVLTNLARGLQQLVEANVLVRSESQDKERLLTQAENYLTTALDLNPNNLTAYLFRGIVRMDKGNEALALNDFDEVLAIQPNHPTAIRRKALLLQSEGNTNEAVALLEQARQYFNLRPWIAEHDFWLEQINSSINQLTGSKSFSP